MSRELASARIAEEAGSRQAAADRAHIERLEWELSNLRNAEESTIKQSSSDRHRIVELESRLTEISASEARLSHSAKVASDMASKQLEMLERELADARTEHSKLRQGTFSCQKTQHVLREDFSLLPMV